MFSIRRSAGLDFFLKGRWEVLMVMGPTPYRLADVKLVMPSARELVDRLPGTVRVGPYDLAIEKWSPSQAAGNRRWGEFSPVEQTIRIQADMPTSMKALDTLLHELGHAVYWAAGVEDDDKEERIVGLMASMWAQVYRDNPWLLDWIGTAVGARS